MRKLIRRWLYGGTSEGATAPVHAVFGSEAPVYISRISNGFIVQHGGHYTYCQKADDIAGVVVSLFARQSLGEKQYELFAKNQVSTDYYVGNSRI
jgi:hypothetical protein